MPPPLGWDAAVRASRGGLPGHLVKRAHEARVGVFDVFYRLLGVLVEALSQLLEREKEAARQEKGSFYMLREWRRFYPVFLLLFLDWPEESRWQGLGGGSLLSRAYWK